MAALVEHHAALRQVEVERAALLARGEQRAEGGVEMAQQAALQPDLAAGILGLLHLARR